MSDDRFNRQTGATPKLHHSFLIPQLGGKTDLFLTMRMAKIGRNYDWLPQTSIPMGDGTDQKDDEAKSIIEQRFGITITASEVAGVQDLGSTKGTGVIHLVRRFEGTIDLERLIRWHKADYRVAWSPFTFATFGRLSLYQMPVFPKALELLMREAAFFTRNPNVERYLEDVETRRGVYS